MRTPHPLKRYVLLALPSVSVQYESTTNVHTYVQCTYLEVKTMD